MHALSELASTGKSPNCLATILLQTLSLLSLDIFFFSFLISLNFEVGDRKIHAPNFSFDDIMNSKDQELRKNEFDTLATQHSKEHPNLFVKNLGFDQHLRILSFTKIIHLTEQRVHLLRIIASMASSSLRFALNIMKGWLERATRKGRTPLPDYPRDKPSLATVEDLPARTESAQAGTSSSHGSSSTTVSTPVSVSMNSCYAPYV